MTYTPINKGQFSLETQERLDAFERRRGAGCEAEYAENRRLWHELPAKRQVSDYPLHVDLEMASICNLRCPMCYTITEDFRKRVNAKLMDWDLFRRLVDECARGGVYSIRLSLRGEAFLHPRIVDAVRYCKDAGIKEVSSLTNGGRLDAEMFTAMMEAGLDWVTYSVDGVGETYERIRRPLKFDDMISKLTAFWEIREKAGSAKPAIKVQTILPAIENDPDKFYQIFAPISDMVSTNPLIDFMQDKSTLPKYERFTCPQIYQRLVIGADGLCLMCANDERGDHQVGDANSQTIHEIWHGDALRRIRTIHVEHRGCAELGACANCYLPLRTVDSEVDVGGRAIRGWKYLQGTDAVEDLNTPAKWKR